MARRGTLLCFVRANAAPSDTPLVPAEWVTVAESNRWSTVYPLGRPGVSFQARLIVRDSGTPTRALFVCVGAPAVLQYLADRIASDGLAFTRTWPDLPTLRSDPQATAVAIRTAWPDERPLNGTHNGAAGAPIGTLIALWGRMAGWLGDDAEGGVG